MRLPIFILWVLTRGVLCTFLLSFGVAVVAKFTATEQYGWAVFNLLPLGASVKATCDIYHEGRRHWHGLVHGLRE